MHCCKCGRLMSFANPSTFWYTIDGVMCEDCHNASFPPTDVVWNVVYPINEETRLRAEIEALKMRVEALEKQLGRDD